MSLNSGLEFPLLISVVLINVNTAKVLESDYLVYNGVFHTSDRHVLPSFVRKLSGFIHSVLDPNDVSREAFPPNTSTTSFDKSLCNIFRKTNFKQAFTPCFGGDRSRRSATAFPCSTCNLYDVPGPVSGKAVSDHDYPGLDLAGQMRRRTNPRSYRQDNLPGWPGQTLSNLEE